jgi:glycosyltransferase involved in cell wall biosynthesis
MHVAVLAYHFPPIGGAGAQRSLKFARYLPELGHEVTVVTGTGASSARWTPIDETLAAEVSGVEVRRVAEREPDQSGRWRGRAERWLGAPSPWSRWWMQGAARTGSTVGGVDVVLASMPPYAPTARAAAALARKLGTPWVADLRDPWALDEMMVYPSFLHRRRELARMRTLLSSAAAVVTTTPEAARRVRERLSTPRGQQVVSIPNGYDLNDFEDASPRRHDDVFRIVHAGYLHTDMGLAHGKGLRRLLAGSINGVEILARSHVYLTQAIDRLIARDPSLRSRIELVLAGVLSQNDREVAARSPFVRTPGYLSHRATIALMRTANLLFLPMYNLPPGARSGIVPGKTYEYLAARRPILAAVPEGDARDILTQAGTAYICAPDDVGAMATAIESELESPRRASPPRALLERFDRRALTRELASLLGAVTDGAVSRPKLSRLPGSLSGARSARAR